MYIYFALQKKEKVSRRATQTEERYYTANVTYHQHLMVQGLRHPNSKIPR